jgi:hypothetical protein
VSEAKRQRDIDNAHRALGHYIAEFSQLIAYMRRYTALRISGVPERELGEIPLGELHAAQISGAFFQLARQTNSFSTDEKAIETWLRNQVRKAAEDRNNYAHGDWWVGLPSVADAVLFRIKPRASEPEAGKFERIPADELDDKAEELADLFNLVVVFALVCLEQPAMRAESDDGSWRGLSDPVRLSDLLEKHEGRVRSKPPKTQAERRQEAVRALTRRR